MGGASQVDQLNRASRNFYERALHKRVASLMFAAFGMMFLGFVAESGALATVNNLSYASGEASMEAKSVYARRGSGYGFSCFVYMCASLIGIAMAIYISPDVGSEMEKRILTNPINVIGGDDEEAAGGAVRANDDEVPDYTEEDDGDFYAQPN